MREAQLLKGIAEGLSNKGLGQQFGISAKTARNQLSKIYLKLGVSSRAEAVMAGVRQGILE